MKIPFPGNEYHTPEDTPRFLIDRLVLGCRWSFHLRFARTVFAAAADARAGRIGDAGVAPYSLRIFRDIEGCGGRFHLQGLDVLRAARPPLVFVANHMSTLETMILPMLIQPHMKTTFVVKRSLLDYPVFGPIIRALNPIAVGRRNPAEDLHAVLRRGRELLDAGISLVIFPQSKRCPVFHSEQFNSLGVKLARSAGTELVPVALKTDFWGYGRMLKDFGPIRRDRPIHFAFGEPLRVQGNGRAEHERTIAFITAHLGLWRA